MINTFRNFNNTYIVYNYRLYKSTEALQKHRKIHENEENPFQCEFCPKKYYQYGALKSHLQFHSTLVKSKPIYPVAIHYLCHYEVCKATWYLNY